MAGVVIGCSLIFDNYKPIKFKNIWVGALLIFTLIGFVWIFFKPLVETDKYAIFNIWQVRPMINVVLGIFLFITIIENTDSIERWLKLTKLLCWIGAIIGIYALMQWCELDQIFGNSQINHVNGFFERKQLMFTFFGNKHLTAVYMASVAPLCLIFRQLRYKVFYGIMLLAIFLADVTIGIIASAVALLIFMILLKRFRAVFFCLFLIVVIFGVSLILHPDFLAYNDRLNLWKDVWASMMNSKDMSFTGNGLGMFPRAFKSGALNVLHAHNEILQMFYEGGIFLLIIFFGYLVSLGKRILHSSPTVFLFGYISALASYLTISLVSFPFRIAPLALLGILYLACLEVQTKGETYA